MTEAEHLPHAPIVEAVLEITAVLPKTVDQEKLASLQSKLGQSYPAKQIRTEWTGQVEFKPNQQPVTKTSQAPLGYLFSSPDGKQVVQARRNGFGFSRLKPYQDWHSLSAEARRLWKLYSGLAKPEKVTRIGLRYINRLELPLPFGDFKEYILTGPEIAAGLPQGLSTFFFRAVIPDETIEGFVTITETIEEVDGSRGILPLILDIDVFRLGSFPVADDKLWPMFQQLHDLKNRVFFRSITDKAKELFK